MQGPWQRLMWYSRHGRWSARWPSRMSIVQVRNGKSPRPLDPGEIVAERDLDVRVRLVVLEPDVVLRLVALHEVALEQERLRDRVGQRVLDVDDPIDDGADEVQVGGRRLLLPVAPHAAAEAGRFANVQDLAASALHEVHPGSIRERPQGRGERGRERGRECGRGGHARILGTGAKHACRPRRVSEAPSARRSRPPLHAPTCPRCQASNSCSTGVARRFAG